MSRRQRALMPTGHVASSINAVLALCSSLGDDELTARLGRLSGIEQGVSAVLVAHLSEFDKRGLYLPQGYGSLFTYCVRELGYSESAAYKRILAARAARKFPGIIDRLADARLSLSAVKILAPHLNDSNWESMLTEAEGKTMRELERMAVSLAPMPDRRDCVRSQPTARTPTASESGGASPLLSGTAAAGNQADETGVCSLPLKAPARQHEIPLSPERVHFGFTGGEGLREKLRRIKELTWHTNPAGKLEVLVEALADFYLARKDPGRPKRTRAQPKPR